MGYAEAERFLLRRQRLGIKLGLQNMDRAMEILGRPERTFPSVLVAGSKGKGSLCSFLEGITEAAGCRTGMYTSPHLVEVRERIRVGGRSLGGRDFAGTLDGLRRRLGKDAPLLTYFEWLTVMAICRFADEGVDLAIFEVGLGGRFDATNILPADLAVVTEIEKEHTGYLGSTIAQIAREKGGIIKAGKPFCSGVTPPSARRELAALAKRKGAASRWLDREASWKVTGHSIGGLKVDLDLGESKWRDLRIGTLGRHQARNAALAVLAADVLRERGFGLRPRHVREGLADTRWPGRCEYRPGKPPLFLDGAHTPASVSALVAALDDLFPRRRPVLLFGVLGDKKIVPMARLLFPRCRKVVLTTPPEARGASPEQIMHSLPPSLGRKCTSGGDVAEALALARRSAGRRGLVVVAGSLFLVGAVLGLLAADT